MRVDGSREAVRSTDHSEEGEAAEDLTSAAAYVFDLPAEQIAEQPAPERDHSRLMRVCGDEVQHAGFEALVDWLAPGDLLVVNDVAVQRARIFAVKPSGGKVELLVLDTHALGRALPVELACFVKARRSVAPGCELGLLDREGGLVPGWSVRLTARDASGATMARIDGGATLGEVLQRCGELPLPPYIVKRRRELGQATYDATDDERYQTVYANEGAAVAAPTAGLHFTQALLDRLATKGIRLARVRLDVGPGTFQPMRTSRLDEHHMHSESYRVGDELVDAYQQARARGGRVVAVGTTVVRALEDQYARHGGLRAGSWETDIFLRPGHTFQAVDAMITNFHLPGSTLLVLVSAFGGHPQVMRAYREAVAQGYRFYSYGDAMLLWPAAAACTPEENR